MAGIFPLKEGYPDAFSCRNASATHMLERGRMKVSTAPVSQQKEAVVNSVSDG